jgi:hypothetical protein
MKWLACIAALALTILSPRLTADAVAVHHTEGIVHGFLVLRTLDGVRLADGDLLQTAHGDRVTTRLVFRFKDGSVNDETAVYTQHERFHLVSDHLVQKGTMFPRAIDMTVNGETGEATTRYTDGHGAEKVETEKFDVPPDLSNGLINTLLKNVTPDDAPKTIAMIAATPKPRLVKLAVSSAGAERFSIAGTRHTATHYVLKVEIGGLAGVVAPIVGKQPPDAHVWILGGEFPAFVRSEQQLYLGGPVWRIELASPTWPRPARATK